MTLRFLCSSRVWPYTRAGTGNYEVWTELLANRDWAALEEIWSQANDAPGGEVADGLTPNGN